MAILHVVMFNLLIIQMVRIYIESVSYLCSDLALVYLFELCNVHLYKYDVVIILVYTLLICLPVLFGFSSCMHNETSLMIANASEVLLFPHFSFSSSVLVAWLLYRPVCFHVPTCGAFNYLLSHVF